ncbi:hypothetical protein RND71_016789 [Anisodus tanguticus]|uniref:AP2/ERF domain-containing protein n=1 Tax=Anisodus tanguticus TaxID=243964 RepID=A0AAE1S913_9SOLA|nr:hypothetical protein RND71_016789 [Anisodus tanguticus]
MSARVSRRNKRIDSHKTTTHIFGVHQRKDSGKYTTEIRNPISKKRIWLGTFATAEEASRAYQSKKLEFQKLVNAKQDGNSEKLVNVKQGHENSSKKVELQNDMPTDSSAGEKQEGKNQEGQEDDEDLWMGEWVQLPGNRAVKFSLKLGLPIIDNYGSLSGEFSTLDDLSIC